MNPSFEPVPGDINFFISHPMITGILTNRISFMVLVAVLLVALYLSIRQVASRKLVYIIPAVLLLLCVFLVVLSAKKARIAINPDSGTIIAAILKDKQIVSNGLCREYYFITEIEGKSYGVATSREIYSMDMYGRGATFDYSLYTYRTPSGFILYRFLKPEFKVKSQRGNLQ